VAIKTDSTLTGRFHFTNLSEGELGIVMAALGLHPQHRFLPKVGAGKPVGLGSVEVQIEALELFGSVQQSGRMGKQTTTYSGPELATRADGWLRTAQAQGLLNEKALAALAAVLSERNLTRPPVEGMY